MMKKNRLIGLSVVLFLLIGITVACQFYLASDYRPDRGAWKELYAATERIQICEEGNVTYFIPECPTAGLIFYPGGKVMPEAYAPLLVRCAENGYLCALAHMPANLAVLNPGAAESILAAHPEIGHWYIGGHSLGGAMAANYAAGHADQFDGLILLAAYSTKDLTASGLKVLSVYGTEDGVLNRVSYRKYLANLPAGFTEIVIEGGCHAYFGYYGPQNGDGAPSITRKSQIEQTVAAILAM